MSEPERPRKKPPVPLDRKAVADGARDAVKGNNAGQAFLDQLAAAVHQRLLINEHPEDARKTPEEGFAEGVEAEKHWRDHICPNGENHGLGPYIPPPKPPVRKLSNPGELVEFEEHQIGVFKELTPPVAESFKRFLQRLYRRDVAFGWVIEWWKWIVGCIGAGWAYAQLGHEHLPDIKAVLTWILAHLQ